MQISGISPPAQGANDAQMSSFTKILISLGNYYVKHGFTRVTEAILKD